MLKAKQAAKRKRRSRAMPALGAAGLSLTLATGASAGVDPQVMDVPTGATAKHHVAMTDEEVCDVSLSTFYLFDKENGAAPRSRLRFALAGGCGCGCNGCGGCGCWTGTYYTSPVFGPPPPPPIRPARKHVRKRAHPAAESKD